MKKLGAVAVFLVMLFAGRDAGAVVDIDARYWFTELDDSVRVTNSGVAGTDIDLVGDLGVDGKENFYDARVTLELGSHKLRYGFMPLKWEGSKVINRQIFFNGQTYDMNDTVESELSMDYHRLGYEYDFIDTLGNRLGVIFELKYFDGEAGLRNLTSGIDESETFSVPIPTVGVSAQASLPFLLSVGGEITGVSLGSDAYIYDAEASVNLKPAPFVVISGGYRVFKLHLEGDDDKADVTVKGPFVMVKADF